MVSTRQHPSPFPPPELPPSLQSSPSKRTSTKRASPSAAGNGWSHTATSGIMIWLGISVPLVIWDTGYVLGRPYTMPGGFLHWPVWAPYELYGSVDYLYGWPAYNSNNGFTAAQGTLNLVETFLYFVYLFLVLKFGAKFKDQGDDKPFIARLGLSRQVSGRPASAAALILLTTLTMTLSKTIIYWLNEAFSGFHYIGHNTPGSLFFLWIVPNGAWIIVPAFLLVGLSKELVSGLDAASGASVKKAQ